MVVRFFRTTTFRLLLLRMIVCIFNPGFPKVNNLLLVVKISRDIVAPLEFIKMLIKFLCNLVYIFIIRLLLLERVDGIYYIPIRICFTSPIVGIIFIYLYAFKHIVI